MNYCFLKMGRNPVLDIQICGMARLGDSYSQWKAFFHFSRWKNGFLQSSYMRQGLTREIGFTSCTLLFKKYIVPQTHRLSEGEAALEVTQLRGLQTDFCQSLGSTEGVVVMASGNNCAASTVALPSRFCLSRFDFTCSTHCEGFSDFLWMKCSSAKKCLKPWPNVIPQKVQGTCGKSQDRSEAPLNFETLNQSCFSFYYIYILKFASNKF